MDDVPIVVEADLAEIITRAVCILVAYLVVVIPNRRGERSEVEYLVCISVFCMLLFCAEELENPLFEHQPCASALADSLWDATSS